MDAMNLKQREIYVIKRRQKRIRLKEIAEYIGCSQSLLSKYETGTANIIPDKLRMYQDYIDKN